MWYTQWKNNTLVESDPIERVEFIEAFFLMYFPRERREVKVEELINLKKGNMSVKMYSLKFTIMSRHSPFLVSNRKDYMSRFVTGIADLKEEEFHTTILHNDMNMFRLRVYAQYIKEPKLS